MIVIGISQRNDKRVQVKQKIDKWLEEIIIIGITCHANGLLNNFASHSTVYYIPCHG